MHGQKDVSSPAEYIASLEEPRRSQVAALDALIRESAPSMEPHIQMGMLAYGSYHYKYASGKEADWPMVALASNKQYISLYVSGTEGDEYIAEKNANRLGKVSVGKSCIRFKRLEDLDLEVTKEVVKKAEAKMHEMRAAQ